MEPRIGWDRVWSLFGEEENGEQNVARGLGDYDGVGCLVLLGPPGAGKTTELNAAHDEAVAAGATATLVLLRQVTRRAELQSLLGRGLRATVSAGGSVAVFLDGLDELPADDATLRLGLLDELATLADEGRASPAGRAPRLRITCRTAELPDDFVRGLEAAWDGDVALLRLEPLGQDDLLLAVGGSSPADVAGFAAYVDARGLRSLTSWLCPRIAAHLC